jgi:formamidopyrimidine-DNA glycosylase
MAGKGSAVPEMIEIELYRRLAERTVGRRIAEVVAPDAWFLKGVVAAELRDALTGREVTGTGRRGKLLLLHAGEATLGLRFGMTGRLVVDGDAAIDVLEYGTRQIHPRWDRFGLRFDTGSLVISDPRRLGGVHLEPDVGVLGPDALSLTLRQARVLVEGSRAPLKARLLDQSRIAGLGNLLVDEILWRAGLDPARPAGSLDDAEVRRLHRTIRSTVQGLLDAGGSHLGRLQASRAPGGRCPRDGATLQRRTIGGRTTYSCPVHQVGPASARPGSGGRGGIP